MFRTQIAILEPMIASILDRNTTSAEDWQSFCRIMYRTLAQVKLDLAAERNLPEKEFDFTVAFAITGKSFIGCFQVGDGAIVLRQNGTCETAFLPEKGEFANQTTFLRPGGDTRKDFQSRLFAVSENNGIAITSDGPEHLMFKLPEMIPGKVFGAMFDDLSCDKFKRQDILDYLTDRRWNDDPRGSDDRSLAIIVPVKDEVTNEDLSAETDIDGNNAGFHETEPSIDGNVEPSCQPCETKMRTKTLKKGRKVMKKSICLMFAIVVAVSAAGYILWGRSATQPPVSLEAQMLRLIINNIEPEDSLGEEEKVPLSQLPAIMRKECMDDTVKYAYVVKFDIDNDGEKEWFVDYYKSHGNNAVGYDVFTKYKGKWQKCGDLLGLIIAPMKHNGNRGIFQKYRCGGITRIYTFYELIEGKLVDTVTIEAERGISEKSSALNIKVLSRLQAPFNAFDYLF
jgi:hypothetical protein